MDFSTITEIIIPIDGGVMNVNQLDIDGQTLWKANKEPEWTSLWSGAQPISFTSSSASVTTLTPNSSWGVPSLPLREDTNPKGTFEFRVLVDLYVYGSTFSLKTATEAGGEVLGTFTGSTGTSYPDVYIVIDTKNTSRDVYSTNNINFVGLTPSEDTSIPSTGGAGTNYPMLIGSTYNGFAGLRSLRLTIKTIKPSRGQSINCILKGIEYRLV